jgi:hypothetical protein
LLTASKVLVGFILTGILATLASGILAYLPSLGDSSIDPPPRSRTTVLRLLKACSPHDAEDPVEFWTPILEGFVLNLSDQQLITGLLIVALSWAKYFYAQDYSSLRIAGDLAFFSMITHYATVFAVQRMLREHFKLALLRMVLVFITFVWWLVIEISTSFAFFFYAQNGIYGKYLLALISSVVEIVGFVWVFWAMCLGVSASDLTLKARKAIGEGDWANSDSRQHIVEWLDSSSQDHRLPKSTLGHITFPLWRSLSWLFEQLGRLYITAKSPFLKEFLRIVAVLVFPFRFGYMQIVLFSLGIVNLSVDLALYGLASTWGFGQLLPTAMVILPFFSLAGVYARE